LETSATCDVTRSPCGRPAASHKHRLSAMRRADTSRWRSPRRPADARVRGLSQSHDRSPHSDPAGEVLHLFSSLAVAPPANRSNGSIRILYRSTGGSAYSALALAGCNISRQAKRERLRWLFRNLRDPLSSRHSASPMPCHGWPSRSFGCNLYVLSC
jgi:hypothetical protein